MRSGRALLILLVLLMALASQLSSNLVAAVLVPLVATLLGAHIDRDSGVLARALVRGACRLLPAERRNEELDELLDHVKAAGEHGVLPLTRALSISLVAVPLLALGLRVGRSRRPRSS